MDFIQHFLICLVGLPASGKSTFANRLRDTLLNVQNKYDVIIVDPDVIRESISNDFFDPEKENLVRRKNFKIIEQELKKNKIVISDDLNYYSSMRHDLKEIAKNLNILHFIVYISTPFNVCLEWNHLRGKPIPNRVIENIYKKFDKFEKYNWDRPNLTIDMSNLKYFNNIILQFLNEINYIQKSVINKKKKENQIFTNSYNTNLDTITRSIIGDLLKNSKFRMIKKQILKIRKEFIKEKLNKSGNELEIEKSFKDFLERSLDIEIP